MANFEIFALLMHFAFTHGSSSVNFINLSVNVCSRQVSCRQKSITDCTLYRAVDSIILNILKTEQNEKATYTAVIEHGFSQGLQGHEAITRCGARIYNPLVHAIKRFLLKKMTLVYTFLANI